MTRTATTTCSGCGGSVAPEDAFCGRCGTSLRPSPSVPHPREPAATGPDRAALRDLATTLVPTSSDAALGGSPTMCNACGTSLRSEQPSAVCPACSERSLVLPSSWMWAVGGVHTVRKGLRNRPALCVAADAASLTLVLPDGSSMSVDADHPTAEPVLPRHHLDELRTSPGVLLRYATADRARCPWPEDALIGTAVGIARHDRVLGRLTALDVLTVGRPDLLAHLGLPVAEGHWLGLVAAAREDDGEALVGHAQALPHGRYHRAVGVLAARLPTLRGVPHAGARLAGFLRSHTATEPLAAVVARSLGVLPGDDTVRWTDLDHRARRHPLPSPVREQMIALLAPGAVRPRPARPDALGPGARRLFVQLHPAASRSVLPPGEVAALPVGELDDLVDAGVDLEPGALPPGRLRAHLRARVAPDRLADDELDAHPAERERRRLVAGLASAGTDDPRLASLAALRTGRWDEVRLEALDPSDRPKVARLLAARERPEGLLDDDLLADRTLWPAIEAHLAGDRSLLTEEARSRYGEFSAWLDLHTARDHLFLARWDAAATTARFCLRHSAQEQIRDEALNLLACALHHQGDTSAAMNALEKAIEGEHSPALLANLGVVAGELDGEAAAPHLARIVAEAPSPGLRRGAALRALRLWREDRGFWTGDENDAVLPPVLREPLRRVVQDEMPLDDFRFLSQILAIKDAAWLRSSGALRRSPHAGSWEARDAEARATGPGARIELYASVHNWSAAPEWLAQDRDAFVTSLWRELVDDLDDFGASSVDLCWDAARRVTGLDQRTALVTDYLAIAMVAGRAVDRQTPAPRGLVDHWERTHADHDPIDSGDQFLVDIEELATRRLANLVCVDIGRQVQAAIANYNEWLERWQRSTLACHNQAMDAFARSVEELRAAQTKLRRWRSVSPHAGTRELFDLNLETASEAIPHIQRMILPKRDY